MSFLKDDSALKSAPLEPKQKIVVPQNAPTLAALARTYNRIGGITDVLASKTSLPAFVTLVVWYVESGGAPFIEGSPIIRFENHKFFDTWGKTNEVVFDRHFQFGGRAGVPGKRSQNHKFRNPPDTEWRKFHNVGQDKEYEVFHFAENQAGTEAAAWSTSWGGPQIMGFNHSSIGYAKAAEMANAFSRDERWQVCGFFDFCVNYSSGVLMTHIANRNWLGVATVYNGDSSPNGYAKRFSDAYALQAQFEALPRLPAAPVAASALTAGSAPNALLAPAASGRPIKRNRS